MSNDNPGKRADIRQYRGKPTLFVDDQPELPVFYSLTHSFGGRWSWEEVPARNIALFGRIGVRLFQVDLYFEDIWKSEDEALDFDKACRQITGVVQQCPEAGVVLRVHLNAPFWWNEKYPQECTGYAAGGLDPKVISGPPLNNEDGDTERSLRASLASRVWRKMATEKLVELQRGLLSSEAAGAIIGFHLCAGVYGEWHYWGFFHDPDTGSVMTDRFREWLGTKYGSDGALAEAWADSGVTLANAEVPGMPERDATSNGAFRDPSRERRVTDYLKCQNELVSETIRHFAAVCRRNWPRPCLIGVFYGYFHNLFNRHDTGGHLEVESLLTCPDIDYFSSPQAQNHDTRGVGGSGHSRAIIESCLIHGKLFLDEVDNGGLQSGYTQRLTRVDLEPDADYLAVIRRSALHPLVRGVGFWYYDFGLRAGRGWWDHPVHLSRIEAEVKQLREYWSRHDYRSEGDVLVVYDDQSFYCLNERKSPVITQLVDGSVEAIYRSGAVADHVYLFDLATLDLSRYRAVVFVNTLVMDEAKRTFIREHLYSKIHSVIWLYLPGYCDGAGLDYGNVAAATGISVMPADIGTDPKVTLDNGEYQLSGAISPAARIDDDEAEIVGRCGEYGVVGRKRISGTTVVLSTLPVTLPAFYRGLFASAGAHIWSDEDKPLFAGSGLVWVHGKEPGQRTLSLPNGGDHVLNTPGPSTSLVNLETGQADTIFV